MSDAAGQDARAKGKYWWVRWAVIAAAVVVLTVELVLVWDQLAMAWKSLLSANWWWVLAAVAGAVASMHSFAQIQRTLLRSAGVTVRQWRSEAAFYAGNALSTTLPGGPVLSATFVYRQQRIWGASPVVASWQLVMSGVLQAVGLALLGLGGAFLLGASRNPLSLIFTLGGFFLLLLLAQSVASNPQQIDGIGVRLLSWFNSLRGKPTDTYLDKWRGMLRQLESVQLSRRALGKAFGWSLFNWIADVACLAFAAYAAGGHPSLAALTVAYAAARAVGSIPLMPGGLLVVEAVLVPGLVSSGMTLASAISAMLIYRLVSWIFISTIGWVVFFFMFRTEMDVDPDATNDPPQQTGDL
ncbi:MAG: YbhN family protein [Mycobacterium sp.]